MVFKVNFPGFMIALSSKIANMSYSPSLLMSRTHAFSKSFFSNSFNFRIPKNLMDSFYRSADFYNRHPHLRPVFSNSPSIFPINFIKPIYP